jgi:uncharacterized repeat protein (TIGR02543 family)
MAAMLSGIVPGCDTPLFGPGETQKPATYTVQFVVDGEVVSTQTVEDGKNATAPNAPTKEGYDFIGWDGDYTNVTGNLTIEARWQEKTQGQGQGQGQEGHYTVQFVTDGQVVFEQEVEEGGAATPPTNAPQKAGWLFDGWEGDYTNVTSNKTITAKWREKVAGQEYYTVQFVADGQVVFTQEVEAGGTVTPPTPTEKAGWVFEGWDSDCANITGNKTITAVYRELEYTVEFKDGSATIDIQTVKHGGNATPPNNPEKDGYIFDSWEGDYTNVTNNKTITAKWREKVAGQEYYTVQFVADGVPIATLKVESGGNATPPLAPPKEGWTFVEWEGDCTNITGDTTVTAKYQEKTYTVTFVDDAGNSSTQTVTHGQDATPPTATPKDGYDFIEWDVDYRNVTSDKTITAKYQEKTYTVTFVDNYGNSMGTQTVKHGQNAIFPNTNKEGYTYQEGDYVGEPFKVTSDRTITLIYEKNKYWVTFMDADNNILTVVSVEHGESAVPPDAPTKEGYDFIDWDVDYTNITGPTTVTAKYQEKTVESYIVTFRHQDGSIIETKSVKHGQNVTPPAAPSKTGFTFDRWDGDCNNVTENRTITAIYKEIVNDIPALTFPTGTSNIEFAKDVAGTPLASATYAGGGLSAAMMYNTTLQNISKQSNALIAGYTGVANVYDTEQFRNLKTAQESYRQAMMTVSDGRNFSTGTEVAVDAIWDAVFGNSGAARTAFDSEFRAYQLGHYYAQDCRDLNSTELEAALSAIGMGPLEKYPSGAPKNLDPILATLKTRLLDKINAALDVAGLTDNTAGTNKAKIRELNGYLLNQVGEDRSQFQAMSDDYADAGFEIDFPRYNAAWTAQAEPQQKATQLASNFDPELLKRRVSELLDRFSPSYVKGRDEMAI